MGWMGLFFSLFRATLMMKTDLHFPPFSSDACLSLVISPFLHIAFISSLGLSYFLQHTWASIGYNFDITAIEYEFTSQTLANRYPGLTHWLPHVGLIVWGLVQLQLTCRFPKIRADGI
jgi:hypothetical protein